MRIYTPWHMKLLTRPEEFVMLAIWKLQDDAYSLTIRKQVSQSTGVTWSLSSIYTPLKRLGKKRMVTSVIAPPRPERGGRHKRIYQLTPAGREALLQIRTVEETMWSGIAGLAVSEVKS